MELLILVLALDALDRDSFDMSMIFAGYTQCMTHKNIKKEPPDESEGSVLRY